MTRTLYLACALVAVVLAAGCGAAAADSGFDSAVSRNRELLESFMAENNVPGLAVAVAVKGELVWSEGFGYSNVELKVPVTPKSKFRIASVSKNLTATAAVKLAERNLLDLEKPIGEYLANIPDSWRPITTHQLLSHASGIAHYSSVEDALDLRQYNSTDEALTRFKNRALVHPPGEGESYSSYAYTVVAAVIEAATGKTFLDAIREEVFEPLGMHSTVPDMQATLVPDRTGFYQYSEAGQLENAPYINLSGRWAGSGFLSTAEDLARFGDAHTRSGFLRRETLDRIAMTLRLANGEQTREGLGWGPREDWDGRPTLWGNGRTAGSTCGLMVFPDQELSIALVSNVRGAPIQNGEFYVLALRFLAVIEGREATEVPMDRLGDFELSLERGETSLHASLRFAREAGSYTGVMDLAGEQQFKVLDAFQLGQVSWIVLRDPSEGHMIPLRIRFQDDQLSGDLLRTGLTVTGSRLEAG